ncbi:MAG: shikimate kinase [Candidatus Levyibacteriota bacterium]
MAEPGISMKIVIIGFMGSGKTTVAVQVGKLTGMKVIEMDELILTSAKRKTVNELFEKDGELRFRELEIETAKKIKDMDNVVVSTGGGVVMNKIIIDYLRQNNGVIVHLETSFYEIERRLAKEKDKPLFKNVLAARKLYEFRHPLYDFFSDYMVMTNGKSTQQVAHEVVEKLAQDYPIFIKSAKKGNK